MFSKDDMLSASVVVIVIAIAFSWIGYAYLVEGDSERMILHPVVPLLLIVLLFKCRMSGITKSVSTIAIAFIGIWLFLRLQGVFIPFIVGFALAYVVNVALSGLQNIPLPKGRHIHLSRLASVFILLILVIGIMIFLAFGIVPQLVQQSEAMKYGVSLFYNSMKEYVLDTMEGLKQGEYPFKDSLPETWQNIISNCVDRMALYIQEKIPSLADSASEIIRGLFFRISSGFVGTIGRISTGFFIFIVFIYAIQSFQSHVEKLLNVFPERQRQLMVRYASEIDREMRSFLKGQLTVIIIISIISIIAYSIIRVPFALLVGLLAGLCNAIPTVGPIIGGGIAILASIVGFVAGNYGATGFLLQIVLVIGIVIGIQLLDNSLISPKIMSSAVDVHPLVVVFAVLLSASLIGVWGAILAIPGIVVCKAVIKVTAETRAEQKIKES